MGEVFLADDTQLGRKVAIKFLTEALEADETARERLHREARSAAALDHPFVCKIYELADIDGRTGIVMEHVTGETLQARLKRAALSPKEALEIASEVAEAMEAAHKRRLIHRDLKTSNVMLTDEGHVKVMDFGLAKTVRVETPSDDKSTGSLTDPGVRVGTPGSMAPEQLLGGHVDERSDIFAFGILLYELLAGVHPFARASPSGTMKAILKETPAPISQYAKDAPESARVTLDRLLAKEPHQRYQSFGDLRTDLGQLLRDASGLTPVPQTDPAASTSADGRTPFVGRESEQAEAGRLLERAVAGHGGVLLIGGEPGVGKTRLAEEVLAEGRQRGALALTGRCYETEGTPPFIPWVEMVERSAAIVPKASFREALGDAAPEVAKLVPELRRSFSDIPAPIELPPEQQRRYLFNSFLDFVRRGTQVTPQVWLIDDLHWADDSTLLLLQHVAQHASGIPLLIVGTYRDVDLEVARPLAKVLGAFTRQRLAHKVALRRLPETGVSEMLQALSGEAPPADLTAAVYAETEGNPFFVEEVFQHLSDEGRLFDADGRWRADLRVEDLEVPEGVRLVIGQRVERLSPEARQILTVAAIVGRSFNLALLEALGDAEGDTLLAALEEAEAAKLIQTVSAGREVRWEFVHGLIRQTLASSLPLMRRQRAHLRVAEAMERVYGDNVEWHASDVAQHLYQAGMGADPDKTVRFLTLAGDQSLDAGAFDEALRQFEYALSVLEREGPPTEASLRRKKGQSLRSIGRWAEAIEEWMQSLTIYEALKDHTAIASLCWETAYLRLWNGQATEAVAVAKRGLAALGPTPSADRCRLLGISGWALGVSAEAAEAVMAGEAMRAESVAMAETLKEPSAHRGALFMSAWHYWISMRHAKQAAAALHAAELFRSAGDVWNTTEALANFQLAALSRGRLEDAARFDEETGPVAQRLGNIGAEFISRTVRSARDWLTTADLDQFESSTQGTVDFATSANVPWVTSAEVHLAVVSIWRGDWERARARAASAVRREPRGFTTGFGWSVLFVCECLLGHKTTALALLEESRSRLPSPGTLNTSGAWTMLLGVVEGLALLDERASAAKLYPLAQEALQTESVTSQCYHLLQTIAGIAAAAGAQWEQAETHYETALRQAHEIPFRSEQPEVRRWYAQMLLDRNQDGDRDKARTLLSEAIGQYRTIGMPKHLVMAEGMLKDT